MQNNVCIVFKIYRYANALIFDTNFKILFVNFDVYYFKLNKRIICVF